MACSACANMLRRRNRSASTRCCSPPSRRICFDGRLSGGRHSLEKMLPAIGTASAPMLVRLLGDPKAPYRGLAELLVKVGDADSRDKGGAALIGRMSSGKAMPNDLWISLGMIGGPTATEFLLGKMQKGSPEDAVAAARALQQSRFPAALPVALKIAGDPKATGELRDEAFGVGREDWRTGGPEGPW